MAGKGEIYRRNDGKWAFRVTRSDGQIVTDSSRGYPTKAAAHIAAGSVLTAAKTVEATEDAIADGTMGVLPEFLDMFAQAGLLNPSTAQSSRTAVKAVRGVTDYWPDGDVRELDLDAVCEQFAREAHLSGQTTETYQSRFRKAVEMYRQWLDNPDGFKAPPMRDRLNIVAHGLHPESYQVLHLHGVHGDLSEQNVVIGPVSRVALVDTCQSSSATSPDLLHYPFPLDDGRIARLELPHPLTRADAERLSQFVLALATEPPAPATDAGPDLAFVDYDENFAVNEVKHRPVSPNAPRRRSDAPAPAGE